MNDTLKQRLVGALILVALGVIFWPIIFVQPSGKVVQEQRRIPPRPEVATAPLPVPDQIGLRTSPPGGAVPEDVVTAAVDVPAPSSATPSADAVQPQHANTTVAKRSEPPVPLALDANGVPQAWILQVITVSGAEKAKVLRDQLIAKSYKAYVKKIESGGKFLYRVYVGPKFERAKLDDVKADIDAQLGVSSLVVRYVP